MPSTEINVPAIGRELRRLRTSLDLTLQEFAVRVGVPWQTVQAYEAGRTVPPSDRLLRIVHATRNAPQPFQFERVARDVAKAA